jgi:hypothetical protein
MVPVEPLYVVLPAKVASRVYVPMGRVEVEVTAVPVESV